MWSVTRCGMRPRKALLHWRLSPTVPEDSAKLSFPSGIRGRVYLMKRLPCCFGLFTGWTRREPVTVAAWALAFHWLNRPFGGTAEPCRHGMFPETLLEEGTGETATGLIVTLRLPLENRHV